MSLRERLGVPERNLKHSLFSKYGVIDNPFPSASQTNTHPHMPTDTDATIEDRLRTFINDKRTQVLIIEGTQGIGKTNLLEYYANELIGEPPILPGYIIVRYSPDPEPDFGRVVQRIIHAFGHERVQEIGIKLSEPDKAQAIQHIKSPDLRNAFKNLAQSNKDKQRLGEVAVLCFDYLLGNRLLKRHTEVLGVHFRIDTTEAKTQALHDLVYLSVELGVLSAVFLFMDELEKVGGLHSVSITTRYLYGIRALIDALPDNLFMMMGITPDARQRYAEMFPALSARFQQSLRLNPLRSTEEAIKLFRFYLDSARERAKRDSSVSELETGKDDLVFEGDARKVFDTLQAQGGQLATRPITQRAFLGSLYNLVDKRIQDMMQ